MKIKETVVKDYICDFCGLSWRSEEMKDIIKNHEKECFKNPNALEYIKSETKKVKLKLIELVYKELKDDKDLKTLISIKDGNYANDVKFIIHHKISNLLNNLNYDEGYHIPVTTCHSTYNQIRKIIIKKLEETK
jgi:hypothetical protein